MNGVIKGLKSLNVTLELMKDKPFVVVGIRTVGIKANGLLIVSECLLVMSQFIKSKSPVVVDFNIAGCTCFRTSAFLCLGNE